MPEGPEIWIQRKKLAEAGVVGRRVIVEGRFTERLRIPIPDLTPINGQRIKSFNRTGKVLGFVLDNGLTLVSHLGMTGCWNIHKGVRPPDRTWMGGHHHIVLRFEGPHKSDTVRLIYTDPRRFGSLQLMDEKQIRDMLDLMGIEPTKCANHKLVRTALLACSPAKTIKAALMDYRIFLSIGNIYASEILHRTGIHPATKAREVAPHSEKLLKNMQLVLAQAMSLGGSSIHSYRAPDGSRGLMQNHYVAYNREGHKCGTRGCTSNIRRDAFVGDRRSSFWCPSCQPEPDYAVYAEATGGDDD